MISLSIHPAWMSHPDSIVVLSGTAHQWLIETTGKRSRAWYLNDLVSRMTVRRILERMKTLGLIRIHANQLTCILDILCVLGWNSSDLYIRNHYWQPAEGLDLSISGRSPDACEDSPSAEPPGFPSQPTIGEILERRQLRIDFDSVVD